MKFLRQVPYDEVLKQSIEEDWGFVPVRCPKCGNGAVSYGGDEDEHGHQFEGMSHCWCDFCHQEWWEQVDTD